MKRREGGLKEEGRGRGGSLPKAKRECRRGRVERKGGKRRDEIGSVGEEGR